MRHLDRLTQIQTVTDPETGRTYAVPAGGAEDGGDSGDSGDGAGDGDEGAAGDGSDDGGDGTSDDEGVPAGSKDAVLADLAAERQKRKAERDRANAAEKALEEARRGQETEVQKAAREAREEALNPARSAMRRTAVETAAANAGFRDVNDAIRAVDLAAIDVDDDTLEADRETAASLVAELAQQKPYLLTDEGQSRLDGGSGKPRGGADASSGGSGASGRNASQQFMDAIRSGAGR